MFKGLRDGSRSRRPSRGPELRRDAGQGTDEGPGDAIHAAGLT